MIFHEAIEKFNALGIRRGNPNTNTGFAVHEELYVINADQLEESLITIEAGLKGNVDFGEVSAQKNQILDGNLQAGAILFTFAQSGNAAAFKEYFCNRCPAVCTKVYEFDVKSGAAYCRTDSEGACFQTTSASKN